MDVRSYMQEPDNEKMKINLDLFENILATYELKTRQLKFFKGLTSLQSVSVQERLIPNLWTNIDGKTVLNIREVPPKLIRVLHPTKRDLMLWLKLSDAAYTLSQINQEMLGGFLKEVIPDKTTRSFLKNLFFGDTKNSPKSPSLSHFAKTQVEFLEKHNDTLSFLSNYDITENECKADLREKVEELVLDLEQYSEMLKEDILIFRRFFRDLKRISQKPISLKILGTGELSTTFSLEGKSFNSNTSSNDNSHEIEYAYKRMPPMKSEEEIQKYKQIYYDYNRLLEQEIKIRLPLYGHRILKMKDGRFRFFIIQEKLPSESIGSRTINLITLEENLRLFNQVLLELLKVFEYNQSHKHIKIGIDGQIPNWSVKGFTKDNPKLQENIELIYIDTSTPLIRQDGEEMLNAELFLEAIPSFMRLIAKKFMLSGVLDRYYTSRDVIMDLIANYMLYGQESLIPYLVEEANSFLFTKMQDFEVEPFTEREIKKYYRSDRVIWVYLQLSRRAERFIKTKIFRKPYDLYLPKNIKPE